MIGCSFVVDREYFGQIGLLDPGMEVYGGENIELGMRVSDLGGSGFVGKILENNFRTTTNMYTTANPRNGSCRSEDVKGSLSLDRSLHSSRDTKVCERNALKQEGVGC